MYNDIIIHYNVTSNVSPYTVEVTGAEYDDIEYYFGELVIPSSVKHAGIEYAVTSIGERAFYECTALQNITLPNTIVSIGDYSFHGCNMMEHIDLPVYLTSIGKYAFEGCFHDNDFDPMVDLVPNSHIEIPATVTSIGKGAFSYTGLASVSFEEGSRLKKLEDCLFDEDGYLFFVNMPASLTCIGKYAFHGCFCLDDPIMAQPVWPSLMIPKSVMVIDDFAFYGARLGSVTFEDGSMLETIGDYAFMGGIWYDVFLPDGLTKIGKRAFEDCFKAFDWHPEMGNSAYFDLHVPASVETIGIGAFAFSGVASLCFAENAKIKEIEDSLFYANIYLENLTLPKNITTIGHNSFSKCTALTAINMCDNVTSIGDSAFFDCSQVRAIAMSKSVERIGENAFSNTFFRNLELPKSLQYVGNAAFSDCQQVRTITLKSIPEFGVGATKNMRSAGTIVIDVADSDHPFVSSSVNNAPTFSTVKYTRTLANGKYGTIILPFVPDNADNFIFYTLDNCQNDELTFKPVQTVEAGVPYLYKNADGCSATEMTASDVDGTTLKVTSTDPSAVNDWQFKGNYANMVLTGTEFYVISNNQFVNTTANVNMIPFRAYLQNMSASAPKSLRIIEEDGEVTCISAADLEGFGQEHGTVYDLSGRRVTDNANLKGIYIINGKKVLR